MRIDHVIYGTGDLDRAAGRMAAELALTVLDGGRHDGVGTHNRIAPLDGAFIELLAVADPEEAGRSPLGTALACAIARGDGLLAWAVAVADVTAVAARNGTAIVTVGRQGASARLTGLMEAIAQPCLPFFIERAGPPPSPPAAAPRPAISWIELAGDAARIEDWLGGTRLPLRIVAGEPAIRGLCVGAHELR